MQYFCLKNKEFKFKEYSIVPLREEDIFKVKDWRNGQIEILRQKTLLTNSDQLNYYNKIIKNNFEKKQPLLILFSYLKNNECIGYGGLTNIDWESKRTELSYLVDTERIKDNELYIKEFSIYLKLIKEVVFDDLNFNRIFTETYDIRPVHLSVIENNGFKFEGRLRQHVVINNKFVDSLIHGFLKEYYYV